MGDGIMLKKIKSYLLRRNAIAKIKVPDSAVVLDLFLEAEKKYCAYDRMVEIKKDYSSAELTAAYWKGRWEVLNWIVRSMDGKV